MFIFLSNGTRLSEIKKLLCCYSGCENPVTEPFHRIFDCGPPEAAAVSHIPLRSAPALFLNEFILGHTVAHTVSCTFPTAGQVRDFHPLDRALSAHTRKTPDHRMVRGLYVMMLFKRITKPQYFTLTAVKALSVKDFYEFSFCIRTIFSTCEHSSLSKHIKMLIYQHKCYDASHNDM